MDVQKLLLLRNSLPLQEPSSHECNRCLSTENLKNLMVPYVLFDKDTLFYKPALLENFKNVKLSVPEVEAPFCNKCAPEVQKALDFKAQVEEANQALQDAEEKKSDSTKGQFTHISVRGGTMRRSNNN